MKAICLTCGEVDANVVGYSCPLELRCPKCGQRFPDPNGGIKTMSGKEAFLKRPQFYGEDSEEYKKWGHLLEKDK